MKILYNDDNVIIDTISLLKYINEYTKALGVQGVTIDDRICEGILAGMRVDFPHVDGLEKASAFKKMANFMAYFIAEQPIQNPFPASAIGEALAKIPNHQNSIVALQVAIEGLHGAKILDENGKTLCTLCNRIQVSMHSYCDIIEALQRISPATHYKLVTVLLEQMAYKVNPGCQYELLDI